MIVDNLSSLSSRLQQIERQHAADRSDISDTRLAVVNALERFRASRYRLGEILSKYKTFFIEQRGWLVAAKTIASSIGCDERTVRRIVSDYERVGSIPSVVIKALEAAGIDPAARRNASMIERILTMSDDDLQKGSESVVLTSVSGHEHQQIKPASSSRQRTAKMTLSDRRRLAIRNKIRSALQNVPLDQRMNELVEALEEEMYLEWGYLEPVTITITPHGLLSPGPAHQRMVA